MNKRKIKIKVLVDARDTYAGIGTRAAKLRLNKLAKSDVYARALRIALETEDRNISAKRYGRSGNVGGYTYSDLAYFDKVKGIEQLLEIAESQGWTYGIQPSDVPQTTHVIYFDIPGVGQLAWHYSPQVAENMPLYPGVWDRDADSTLRKLEVAIRSLVGAQESTMDAVAQLAA